jgi:molybdenum cofactor biosynthesis enzyme MoaA
MKLLYMKYIRFLMLSFLRTSFEDHLNREALRRKYEKVTGVGPASDKSGTTRGNFRSSLLTPPITIADSSDHKATTSCRRMRIVFHRLFRVVLFV